jgi:hypothetical protein
MGASRQGRIALFVMARQKARAAVFATEVPGQRASLTVGVAIALVLLSSSEKTGQPISAGLVAIAMSLVGSSLFYSRKLYKACIDGAYTFSDDASWTPSAIGTFAFFALRPVFGVALALLMYFLWKSALLASVNEAVLTSSHFYISGAIGFFSGFLAGRVIERFEDRGLSELDRLVGPEE